MTTGTVASLPPQFRNFKPLMMLIVGMLELSSKACKPAPRQMHAQFRDQFALDGNAVEIADQQDAQQQLQQRIQLGPCQILNSVPTASFASSHSLAERLPYVASSSLSL